MLRELRRNHLVRRTCTHISQIGETIAFAISQQECATSEIALSVQTAADGAAQVGESIKVVDKAATELGENVKALRTSIDEFLTKIRAA